jgi:hypothetical protein
MRFRRIQGHAVINCLYSSKDRIKYEKLKVREDIERTYNTENITLIQKIREKLEYSYSLIYQTYKVESLAYRYVSLYCLIKHGCF